MLNIYNVDDLKSVIDDVILKWGIKIDYKYIELHEIDECELGEGYRVDSTGYIRDQNNGLATSQSLCLDINDWGKTGTDIAHVEVIHNSFDETLELKVYDKDSNVLIKFGHKDSADDHHNERDNFFYSIHVDREELIKCECL